MTTQRPDFDELPRDFVDVATQLAAAVVARHPIHLVGPPGIGKTMLARRVPSIMAPLTDHERRWLEAEYDSYYPRAEIAWRPFRAPHHSISAAAMVGNYIRPGEVHLARFGVLFLDELDEFSVYALRSLGQRLRAMHGAPLIIATSMPCPCGSSPTSWSCRCSPEARARFERNKTQNLAQFRETFVQINVAPLVSLKSMREGFANGRCPSGAELRRLFTEV